MTNILTTLTTGWHFARWLRLGLGAFLAFQAMDTGDPLFGLLSAFVLLQALSNTGCCGASGCAMPSEPKKVNLPEPETVYEEVK